MMRLFAALAVEWRECGPPRCAHECVEVGGRHRRVVTCSRERCRLEQCGVAFALPEQDVIGAAIVVSVFNANQMEAALSRTVVRFDRGDDAAPVANRRDHAEAWMGKRSV